jgi:hypothetical protein
MFEEFEVKRFSLKRKEQKVVLETETGGERTCVIREMCGRDRDTFSTKNSSRFIVNDKGIVVGLKTHDGQFALLLSLCMYDEENKLMDIKEIQNFPSSVQEELHDLAQKLNWLAKKEEEIKND